MANSYAELRSRYEDFLRVERFNLVDKISTSIDDYVQRSRIHSAKGASGNEVLGWGCPRVRISMGDLRSENPRLAHALRHDPLRNLRALEGACHAVASEERPGYDKEGLKIKVAVAGPIGATPSSPRNLVSSSLRQMVCVEGVSTKISAIKPKVVKSVHYCPKTGKHEVREYTDATDPHLGLPAVDSSGREIPDKIINITTSVYPTKDRENNPLETEYGLSEYKDHQTAVLQEMPERAPVGQLPRSVDLILDHDLVDKIKPGDRVQIVGVYKALAVGSSGQASTSGMFRTVILVNNIQILGREMSNLTFSPMDIREIRTLGKRNDILSILGRSIAPSIHGHEVIKKALVLQLLSGCEKNLENGTHLRGDINILMVGDPSTAKSQLLRAAMKIAPLAISTTGKGSSGVGLTAAVTTDSDTGERRLEAGAMVLADRGLVCVDEFDKMGEGDRVSLHEAMEQQTVTISKAGIHASLNARCSVLAAANPVYGQYDKRRRIQENIGLPDSLLSRFDLLFIVLDQLDPAIDRRIAAHVIRGHRYRPTGPGVMAVGVAESDDDFEDDESDDENGPALGGNRSSTEHAVWKRSHHSFMTKDASEENDPHSEDVLQQDFLRKYLHFSKTRMKPRLTDEAREAIAVQYAEMRSRQDQRTLPVTVRSLETVIRLASAHAKARLSPYVEANPDVSAATDILSFALYHENNHNVADEMQAQSTDISAKRRNGVDDGETNEEKRARLGGPAGENNAAAQSDEEIIRKIKERVWDSMSKDGEGELSIEAACPDIKDRTQVMKALTEMEQDGRIMISDGEIYQI